jgi:hypothetical protein
VKPVRQLVPLATAAAELSVSQRTLRRWISCGLLPAYRTGTSSSASIAPTSTRSHGQSPPREPRGRPDMGQNETPVRDGGSAATTKSVPEQIRRRREAALTLPPMPCGHRDPVDCRESCRRRRQDRSRGPAARTGWWRQGGGRW